MLLAIDPGNTHSAYCFLDSAFHPVLFDKIANHELVNLLSRIPRPKAPSDEGETILPVPPISSVVIEMVSSYGKAVGREIFDTCVWIGRFANELEHAGHTVSFLYRREVKLEICGIPTANDAIIRRALIDRFALHDLKNGKGTKKNPDWFYGFHADIWAAYAVGVTCLEQQKKGETNG